MNWPAHAEYEETGVEWVGRIPTSWRQVQLRHVIDRIEQGVSPQAYAELADEGWGVLKSGCVNGGVFADVQHKKLPDDFVIDPSIVVNEGDLLVCRASGTASLVGSTAIVRRLRYRLILSDKTFRVRAGPLVSREYLEWAMNSRMYREQVRAAISGAEGLANNLPMSELKTFRFAVPPRGEQKQIVDFLYGETGKIDALIAKQEQLIATLREDRTATIDSAFRIDRDPTRLRAVLLFAQTGPFGTQLSAEEYIADGVPVINPTHIQHNKIVPDPGISVSAEKADDLARHQFQIGDIVLGRKGEVDKSALVDAKSVGFVCGSDSMLLRPRLDVVVPSYLWWFLQSPGAHSQLEQWSVGSTVAGLNQTTMRRIYLPHPPIEDQSVMVRRLEAQTAKVDALVAKAERVVQTLREYRSAIITDAVTGAIDVRGVA